MKELSFFDKVAKFIKKYWPLAKSFICFNRQEADLIYDALAQAGRELTFTEAEAELYAEIMAKLRTKIVEHYDKQKGRA